MEIRNRQGRSEAPMKFHDRRQAGRLLAQRVAAAGLERPLVLALPRGGVPVGYEVAQALAAPLEVFVARKLGAPHRPELGVGAIAEGGRGVIDEHTVASLRVSSDELDQIIASERRELARRVRRYRGERALPDLTGRELVLVDDGLATGVTARAAIQALEQHAPGRLVLAVPVCARQTTERLMRAGTEVVAVLQPDNLLAVGAWYDDFGQTTDDEVIELLDAAAHPAAPHPS
jgi:putative phosphoribosyl transferase